MTNLDTLTTAPTTDGRSADRRVLVLLAVAFLIGFAIMMVVGADREFDDDPTKIIAGYDVSSNAIHLQSYTLMAVCGALVFLGSGIRSALASRARSWTADVILAGFVLLSATYAGFGVTGLALHHAVDIGDPTLVAATNLFDTANFLPAMAAMICIYIGTGATALRTRALPAWLCWVSIALGVASPLGILAFAPFMLMPVWTVLVAALVNRSTSD
jgi:hypothetical protein